MQKITVYRPDTVDSTNSLAKRHALAGGQAPAVFAAREQTAGRGRMGRSFFSPAHTGLYYSLLLPAPDQLSDGLRLTSAAAVATAEAIDAVFGIPTYIKWVNDIYDEQGKKLAGILAESFQTEERRFVIIGIGINLCTAEFPQELRTVAASLCPFLSNEELEAGREALIRELTERLLGFAEDVDRGAMMERYRERSLVLGREVIFTQNGVTRSGIAEAVSDTGALTVRLPNGDAQILSSGEITLRLQTDTESDHSKRK